MAVAASSSIVDQTVGCSAYLLSCGQHCCSNQISIFIGAGLIYAVATEPYPFYIQRRGSVQNYYAEYSHWGSSLTPIVLR